MQRVIPAISPAYHQGTIGMIATMLALAGEDWDRAASRRLEENRRLREIFREAADVIKKPGLNARLTELARTKDEDFRISALERNNCLLRATLIELHAQVESESGPEARRLEGVHLVRAGLLHGATPPFDCSFLKSDGRSVEYAPRLLPLSIDHLAALARRRIGYERSGCVGSRRAAPPARQA